MKIIGKTKEGYILDASANEVANLIGYYGEYSLKQGNVSLGIGEEIKISQMYDQLYKLHVKHNEIEAAKEKLSECIKYMNEVQPVIDVKVDIH